MELREDVDMCNFCLGKYPRTELRRCSNCKAARYCSKECQKRAWSTHKSSCRSNAMLRESLSSDPDGTLLNNELTRWVAVWRPVIMNSAIAALNLPNNPAEDHLATHNVVIEIERRPNPSSHATFFKMHYGSVMTNEEWVEAMIKSKATPEQVEDWKRDKRGNDTVRIIIVCEDLLRFLYFSFRDGGASERQKPRKLAEQLSKSWVQMLSMRMNAGNSSIA